MHVATLLTPTNFGLEINQQKAQIGENEFAPIVKQKLTFFKKRNPVFIFGYKPFPSAEFREKMIF